MVVCLSKSKTVTVNGIHKYMEETRLITVKLTFQKKNIKYKRDLYFV